MRDIRKRRIIILILAAAAILLATGAYVSVPSGVKDIEIVTSDGERVEESYDVYLGETVQLRCRVSPKSFAHRDVGYYVSDEEILSVDESGKLSGIKEGQAKLIVECAGVRKRVSVDVEPSVKEIRGLKKEITLYVDGEYQFEPKVVMAEEELEAPTVTYNSKRKTVAVVDKNGLLTATGEGTTKISIKAGTLSETVRVKVEERPVDVDPVFFTPGSSASSDGKKTVTNKSGRSSRKSNKSKIKSKTGNSSKPDSGSGSNSSSDKGSETGDNTRSDNGTDTGDSGSSTDTENSQGSGSGDGGDSGSSTDTENSQGSGSGVSGDSGSRGSGSSDIGDSGSSGSGSNGTGDSGSGSSDSGPSGSGGSGSDSTGSGSDSDPNSQTDADLTGD